ncbi:MAG: hypothetical protein AAFV95_00215 [Bacteroidota bacterium]
MKNIVFTFCVLGLLVLGTSCSKDDPARDKFLGAYSVVETCGGGNDTYEIVIIESGTGDNAVVLNNLYGGGASLSATVDGNRINIDTQVQGGVTYNGSGTIDDNILTINFTVSALGQSDNCNAVCTRK